MVHKINTDRLYEMHGTPGGTMRDPELKIGTRILDLVLARLARILSAKQQLADAIDQSSAGVIMCYTEREPWTCAPGQNTFVIAMRLRWK